MVILDKKGFSK